MHTHTHVCRARRGDAHPQPMGAHRRCTHPCWVYTNTRPVQGPQPLCLHNAHPIRTCPSQAHARHTLSHIT